MDRQELLAKAYDEAQRLLEKGFSFDNPYTCVIYVEDIPHNEREFFCKLVEEELIAKGEKIKRHGEFFKIERFRRKQ